MYTYLCSVNITILMRLWCVCDVGGCVLVGVREGTGDVNIQGESYGSMIFLVYLLVL